MSFWRQTTSAVPNTTYQLRTLSLLMQRSTWMGNVRERKSTQQATYVTAAASNVLTSHSYIPFIMDRSCHFLPQPKPYIQHTGCRTDVLLNTKRLHHYIYQYWHLRTVRSIYRTGVPLPSRCCILYILFNTLSTEYFKHAAHSPFFSSKCRLFHNATFFGSCIIHILHTGVLKFKCKI
jgi:hypothetical protein